MLNSYRSQSWFQEKTNALSERHVRPRVTEIFHTAYPIKRFFSNGNLRDIRAHQSFLYVSNTLAKVSKSCVHVCVCVCERESEIKLQEICMEPI